MPVAVLAIMGLAYMSAPKPEMGQHAALSSHPKVHFEEVQTVINLRCVSCHATKTTDDVFVVAPAGVKFDRPELIKKYSASIKNRVYDVRNMPLANKTQITDAERALLAAWVNQGAHLD